ncbi:MAG: cellulase family glycosylhydrolase [Clostridia bacterium]|nr:cellulase family glycosylhydrolase [Clostridia bacterium]
MKTNGKATAAAGIAAGVLTAAVPAALGFIASRGGEQTSPRPEKIACDGYGFSTAGGENVKLRILSVRNFTPGVDEREKLFSRFGAYGAAQICAEYEKSVLTDGDLEYIASLGFNCVLVSFSHTLIYPNGKIGKTPDFTALDALIERCCKNGLYIILNLTDARTFAKKEKPVKAALKIWEQIARHCKNDSAVALYDLTALPAADEAFYSQAVKAIRKADSEKEIIAPENSGVKFTYSYTPGSSLIFAEKTPRTSLLDEVCGKGGSVMFEAFKSQFVSLFTFAPCDIDITTDSYEELLKKYAHINDGIMKNELLEEDFKRIFKDEPSVETPGEEKKKFRFNAEFRRGTKLTAIRR